MKEQILALITLVSTAILPASHALQGNAGWPASYAVDSLISPLPQSQILAVHELDLTTREPNPYANEIFAYNILLALKYLGTDNFVLQPGEVFAFHNNVLSEFSNPAVTMNSKFYIEEGYKSVGGLGGNGVCHLASLINWVATEARLEVKALANHNFAPIPGVPKQFGTSVRSQSKNQNLYIRNNFEFPITFLFDIGKEEVTLRIVK